MNFQKLDEFEPEAENSSTHGHGELEAIPTPQTSKSRSFLRKPDNSKHFPLNVLVAIISIIFLSLLALILLVAFIVKCDEKRIIDYFESRNNSLDQTFSTLSHLIQRKELDAETSYKSKKIHWISGVEYQSNPNLIEPSGCERLGNENLLLFVARTSFLNGTAVGKFSPYMGLMYFGYDGEEHATRDYELLVFPKGTLSWIPVMDGRKIPEDKYLVFGGEAPGSKDATYICRFAQDDHVFIGRILKGQKDCSAAYRSQELDSDKFEILAINALGTLMAVES